MEKEKNIWIKCTEEQSKQIKDIAKENGLTVSDFGLSKMLNLVPVKIEDVREYPHNVKGKNGKVREYTRSVITKKIVLLTQEEHEEYLRKENK